MHCRDGYKRRRVNGIQYRVNALQKLAHACESFRAIQTRRAFVKLAQIGARRKSMLSRAGNNANGGFRRHRIECFDKLLKFRKRRRADLISWLAIERQLQDTVVPSPSQRLSGKRFHADFPLYMVAISTEKRRSIASRRNLPMAVSRPSGAVKGLVTIVKFRICR